MTLAERVRVLRATADTLYDALSEHQCVHGCWRRLVASRFNLATNCAVRVAMLDAWIALTDAAALPSPDTRMYRDESGDETTTSNCHEETAT